MFTAQFSPKTKNLGQSPIASVDSHNNYNRESIKSLFLEASRSKKSGQQSPYSPQAIQQKQFSLKSGGGNDIQNVSMGQKPGGGPSVVHSSVQRSPRDSHLRSFFSVADIHQSVDSISKPLHTSRADPTQKPLALHQQSKRAQLHNTSFDALMQEEPQNNSHNNNPSYYHSQVIRPNFQSHQVPTTINSYKSSHENKKGLPSPFINTNVSSVQNVGSVKSGFSSGVGLSNNLQNQYNSQKREVTYGNKIIGKNTISEEPELAMELKKLRLRISDYNKNPVIDNICQKIWRLLVFIQYDENLLELISHVSALPIDISLYSVITQMIQEAMGIYFHTNYYVAKPETLKEESGNVFYQRFVYDLISMFGVNLFYLDSRTLEFLLRKLFLCISFKFDDQKIYLRHPEDVDIAFTMEEFDSVQEQLSIKLPSKVKVEFSRQVVNNSQSDNKPTDESSGIFDDVFNENKYSKAELEEQLRQKRLKVNKIQAKKARIRPFRLQNYQFGIDPVATMQGLYKKRINPLKVEDQSVELISNALKKEPSMNQDLLLEDDDSDNFDQQSLTHQSTVPNLRSLDEIQFTQNSDLEYNLKIYKQVEQFNQFDYDDTLDHDEKIKKRKEHVKIMRKLDKRSKQDKANRFQQFVKCNKLTINYHQANKIDAIFKEVNKTPSNAKDEFGLPKEDSLIAQNSLMSLYKPKLEFQKDFKQFSQHSDSLLQNSANLPLPNITPYEASVDMIMPASFDTPHEDSHLPLPHDNSIGQIVNKPIDLDGQETLIHSRQDFQMYQTNEESIKFDPNRLQTSIDLKEDMQNTLQDERLKSPNDIGSNTEQTPHHYFGDTSPLKTSQGQLPPIITSKSISNEEDQIIQSGLSHPEPVDPLYEQPSWNNQIIEEQTPIQMKLEKQKSTARQVFQRKSTKGVQPSPNNSSGLSPDQGDFLELPPKNQLNSHPSMVSVNDQSELKIFSHQPIFTQPAEPNQSSFKNILGGSVTSRANNGLSKKESQIATAITKESDAGDFNKIIQQNNKQFNQAQRFDNDVKKYHSSSRDQLLVNQSYQSPYKKHSYHTKTVNKGTGNDLRVLHTQDGTLNYPFSCSLDPFDQKMKPSNMDLDFPEQKESRKSQKRRIGSIHKSNNRGFGTIGQTILESQNSARMKDATCDSAQFNTLSLHHGYASPTITFKLKERDFSLESINSKGQNQYQHQLQLVGGTGLLGQPKPVGDVPLAPVIMGDFQLPSIRGSYKERQAKAIRNRNIFATIQR